MRIKIILNDVMLMHDDVFTAHDFHGIMRTKPSMQFDQTPFPPLHGSWVGFSFFDSSISRSQLFVILYSHGQFIGSCGKSRIRSGLIINLGCIIHYSLISEAHTDALVVALCMCVSLEMAKD